MSKEKYTKLMEKLGKKKKELRVGEEIPTIWAILSGKKSSPQTFIKIVEIIKKSEIFYLPSFLSKQTSQGRVVVGGDNFTNANRRGEIGHRVDNNSYYVFKHIKREEKQNGKIK